MFLKLRNDEAVVIESERDKVAVSSNWHGEIDIDGSHKEKSVKDIEYNKLIKSMSDKFLACERDNGWGKNDKEHKATVKKTIDLINGYVEGLSKNLRLDKGIILNALEKNRSYSYRNYYQDSNLPPISTIEEQKEKISKLNQEMWDLKKKHEKEIIGWQKKVTNARDIFVDKEEVETSVDCSLDVNVNCPYCDKWQEVSTGDYYPGDGDFETNQECESCGKIFSVKAEQG